MTEIQQKLQNVVFELVNKHGLTINDDVNFNWHEDSECPQELYYYVKFNDSKIDSLIEEVNIPVFLSISENYVAFDVDSLRLVGHDKHDKFGKKAINVVKRHIVENYKF
jgi:hypothetical protein